MPSEGRRGAAKAASAEAAGQQTGTPYLPRACIASLTFHVHLV